MKHLKAMVEALIKAEEMLKQDKHPGGLPNIVDGVGWTSECLAREVMES